MKKFLKAVKTIILLLAALACNSTILTEAALENDEE